MDRPRQTDHLGVNKTGKNIRKSLLHQPNFANNASARPQAQPQVYSVSKNDFRSVVQQLTGSPSRDSLPRPPPPQNNNNSPRPQSTRLQRVRPAPLTDFNRPSLPPPTMPLQNRPHSFVQPPFPQGTQQQQQPAESPISEYMRYLQSSFGDPGPSGNHMPSQPQSQPQPLPYMPSQPQSQPQPQPPPYMPAQPQTQPHMMSGSQPRMDTQAPLQPTPPGLVPSPMPRNLPYPQFNGPVPGTPTLPSPRFSQMYGGVPSPRYNGGVPSPRFNGGVPSPRWYNGFGSLPSPTSQFVQPSPTGYMNMFSPRSPYPLLSPGVQYPQPLTPNFSFSQIAQSGSHPGPGPSQPPPSPGLMFPPSPSGFFPILSPRWGGY